MCCCCADSDEYYDVDILYDGVYNRSDIVDRLKKENDLATALFRILGFLLHFAGYYGLLYPLIMLIGMIPFLGAVGAVILIFIAFFLAVISFIFLIACAWIFARPLLALLLFSIIGILIVAGGQAEKAMKENGWIKDENSNGNRLVLQHNNVQSNKFLR